jgi:hypothetical protein
MSQILLVDNHDPYPIFDYREMRRTLEIKRKRSIDMNNEHEQLSI